MVGHDHRVRQRLTDGGAVRRARVHSNDLDRVFPPRAAGVQPAQHGALGAPGGLAEQSLSAGKVDEVRLEPLGQPLPGVRVLAPGGPAASGLVNPEHPHRGRLGQPRLGVGDPRPVRHRPAHQPGARGADRRAVGDEPGDVPAQPAGDPHPGRHLGDLLGERRARAASLPAGVLHLVPTHPQRRLPIGQVPRPRRSPLPHRRGEHPTRWARRRGRIVGAHLHHPHPVGGDTHVPNPHSGQSKQDRRTVRTHSWPLRCRLQSTASIEGPRAIQPQPTRLPYRRPLHSA